MRGTVKAVVKMKLVRGIKHRGNILHRSVVSIQYGGIRQYSVAIVQESSAEKLSQKEIREKAVAEALAKEEEALAKAKALRELKNETKEQISILNEIPSDLMRSRLQQLQETLDGFSNQDKVKQLDQELEEFMLRNMNIPASEAIDNPSVEGVANANKAEHLNGEDDRLLTSIKSTVSNSYTNKFPNLKPTPDYKSYSEQELYLRQLAHLRQCGNLGSDLRDIYIPRNEVRKPRDIKDTSISTLMAAGCHLGHAKSSWRPSTQPFIYGEYNGIHLIDLNETITALRRAVNVVRGVSEKGGTILYVGTIKNTEQRFALETAADRSRGYYVSKRWIPGTITNFTEVTKQINGEKVIEVDMMNEPTNRNLDKGTENKLIKPDLVILMNPVENRICISECMKSRIPTIGLCDTDMEPTLLTYPIPCNDDSMRASSLILGILSKAAEDGLKDRLISFQQYKNVTRNHPKSFQHA